MIVYSFLNVSPFDCTTVEGSWKVGRLNQTGWMDVNVVIPTDRLNCVRSRSKIERFVSSLYNFDLHGLSFRGFCHNMASDLFPILRCCYPYQYWNESYSKTSYLDFLFSEKKRKFYFKNKLHILRMHSMVGWLYWGFTSLQWYFRHMVTWKQEITNLWKILSQGRELKPGPLTPQAKSLTTRPPPLPRMHLKKTIVRMHVNFYRWISISFLKHKVRET